VPGPDRSRLPTAIDRFGVPEMSVRARLALDEPLNMRRFAMASQTAPRRARRLHAKLRDLGLVETAYREQGVAQLHEIRLTPLGHDVARHVLAIADALLRGNR
jgi:hypothetical protein